ncbi:MAG: Na-K-Cl cotransporter [Candidatus Latescibacterota bacterium]
MTESTDERRFGTFLGVYVPSVLTILGLVMYLRFGWVVGNVGLGYTFVIVLLASSITCITALSASAIATNMRVGAGGEYFMVAHSLGLEMGGAIGIPLFLCRTLSITFYCYGLAESILGFGGAPADPLQEQLLAAGLIIVITAVSGASARLTLKLQIPIMATVGLSLLALAGGVGLGDLHAPEWTPTYRTAPEGFWYVFAVFFPAVTGFAAGIGMSGDLRDPRRSIPRGTLAAVATGTAVYLVVPVLLATAGGLDARDLAQPGRIVWVDVAFLGAWLILPGVWGAILSSAFGSALGGPRVLQALASDGLAPRFLSRLTRGGQPAVATVVSGAIAVLAVSLGELNAVAQFVTILFLTLYVAINLCCAIEGFTGDPSWRPTLNLSPVICLLGAVGSIGVMFLISPMACVAAVSLELLLYIGFRRRALRRRWGDARAGFWAALARFSLIKLNRHRSDPRNWRPLVLLFSGDPQRRTGLVRMANWFTQSRGLVTACQMIIGDLQTESGEIEHREREMDETLRNEGLVAFTRVAMVPEFEQGVISVAQASGLSGLRANTIMFGWPEKRDRLLAMLRILRAASNAGRSTLIARLQEPVVPMRQPRIDVWWRGKHSNGDLMLLLAYLLQINQEWQTAHVAVRSIVDEESQRQEMETSLAALIDETRIPAEPEVIVRTPGADLVATMHERSANSDLVFIGLRDPEPGGDEDYADSLLRLVDGLPTTVLVRSGGEFAGRLI